jgi:hypothetical protein
MFNKLNFKNIKDVKRPHKKETKVEIISEVIIPDINNLLEAFKPNSLHNICQVYQQEYAENKHATGLGDFIRGTYFLIYFCETYDLNFQIHINHPILKFLKNKQNLYLHTSRLPPISFCNVNNFVCNKTNDNKLIISVVKNTYFEDFIYYLTKQPLINNTLYVYNIVYSNHTIPQEHKQMMRYILEPDDEINTKINKIFRNLSITTKQFIVIHVRSGDEYLINDKTVFSKNYLNKIIYEIYLIKQFNTHCNAFYLLSDSCLLKKMIIQMCPTIKTVIQEISHLGEGVKNSDESIKNNLVDFFIMSQASKIFAFTVYEHGSGFSKWCAETYDIPYVCKLIK